jgi:UDP-glucose 4-epimerase
MRIVVTGATGNVGTAVLRALGRDPDVDSILGLARRIPEARPAKVEWAEADVVSADLAALFRGADAVIHLAWLIQPGRDEETLHRVNVDGSVRVFQAAAQAGVGALIHASSIGAYSRGPKQPPVKEDWPTTGIPSSFYSRHKAACEHALDEIAAEHPELRIVRLRPALIFQRSAATEIRRYFVGPFLPNRLVDRRLLPVVPDVPGLAVQAVHTDDVAEAYRLAVQRDVQGAFNIAADPPLDPPELARILGARRIPVPARVLRALADATFRLHLQPTEPGWLDMGLAVPLMDTTRAREELGWTPRRTSEDALLELMEGLRQGADADTPVMARTTGGPARVRELLQGVGRRN